MLFSEQHAVDLGVHPDVVKQAVAAGIDIQKLLQLLVQFGPVVLQILAQLFNLQLPPVVPPAPPGVLIKP